MNSSGIEYAVVLVIYVPCHLFEVLVPIVARICDAKFTTAHPPTKASVVGSVHQDHWTVWPVFSEEVYLRGKDMALDYAYAAGLAEGPWAIELAFTGFFGVLIQLVKPATKLHAWIPVSTYVHQFLGASSTVIVGAILAVVSAIYVSTIVDVLDHAAPLAAGSTSDEYVFGHQTLFMVLSQARSCR